MGDYTESLVTHYYEHQPDLELARHGKDAVEVREVITFNVHQGKDGRVCGGRQEN